MKMKSTAKRQLDTIAGRLIDGHACLFVGAGFSKNATVLPGGRMPVDWNELGDLFIEKARGHKPDELERKYTNVLRLAEEVECTIGRAELLNLISDAINDEKLEPSDIYMELLSFPWKDVFTTNYDTLLDRTAQLLDEQGKRVYSLITAPHLIGTSSQPFLMKLHGDIKDPDSIIITEEDYRKYPLQHQAMINHIQHSIMLETLVLIGFSGNDPNFIQWLGWVKDSLKSKQRKVYMLSVDRVSESEAKMFAKKNIDIVDLHDFVREGASPHDNISEAIHYIAEIIKQREADAAFYRKEVLSWGLEYSREEDINKQYQRWKAEREDYPGWLVMPREKRERWANVGGFSLPKDKLKELNGSDDLLYLDLFNWRIEKCLFPIENSWEPIYLSVLNKYEPFEKRTNKDIKAAWVNIKLGLLRLYRQEAWHDKWVALNKELGALEERFSKIQQCRLRYEQCLMAVYQSDFKELRTLLEKWPEQKEDYYWDIRRGSLWAEYLSLETGKKYTKRALDSIQQQLNAVTVEKDRYYWGSRLANAQAVWNCMAQANFSLDTTVSEEARNVWIELRSYDDIWYEREFFSTNLRPLEKAKQVITKAATFNLGRTKTTTNLSGNSMDYRVTYAFFLYYEDTAFPIHLPYLANVEKSTLEKALSVMIYCSPAIAECWLLRSGDPKVVDSVFNRRYLALHSANDITAAYKRYLGYLKSLLVLDSETEESPWGLVYRSILPEILSRLCMKVPYGTRVITLGYIDKIFKSKKTTNYRGVESLLSSLMASFSNDQISRLIPRIAVMSVGYNRRDEYLLEPFYYLNSPTTYNSRIRPTVVKSLFNRLGKNEYNAKAIVFRLLFLMHQGALDINQQNKLMGILWSKSDSYGFPEGTPFAKFAFLALPHPQNVDPQALLREYISKAILPKMENNSIVSITGGDIPLLNEIRGTINDNIIFDWDTKLLNAVCADIVSLWESDKHLLTEKKESFYLSVKEELKKRLVEVEMTLVSVVPKNLSLVNKKNRQALAKMIIEMEKYGIPALRLKVAFSEILKDKIDIDCEIRKRLGSANEREIDDCIKTIIYLDKHGQNVAPWLELMTEYFRGDAIQGRRNIISGLNYFVEKEQTCITETMLNNLILGLDRLFNNSNVVITDSELV